VKQPKNLHPGLYVQWACRIRSQRP